MNYKEIKCKLGENDIQQVEEINKFFQDFKKQYVNADTKKEFCRENNIITNENVIYNLKLIFDMFNWQEISVENINKIARERKKKPEHILNTTLRRIKDFQSNKV